MDLSPTWPNWLQGIDDTLLVWLEAQRHPWLDSFFRAVSWAGSLYVLLPLAGVIVAVLLKRRQKREAVLLVLGFGGAAAITYALKLFFGRPRQVLFPPLIPMPTDLSFPSSHTSQITAFALCTAIIVCRLSSRHCRTAAVLAVLIAGLVGLSRLYLQVHFLSDVIAGALLSLLWVGGLQWVQRHLAPPHPS